MWRIFEDQGHLLPLFAGHWLGDLRTLSQSCTVDHIFAATTFELRSNRERLALIDNYSSILSLVQMYIGRGSIILHWDCSFFVQLGFQTLARNHNNGLDRRQKLVRQVVGELAPKYFVADFQEVVERRNFDVLESLKLCLVFDYLLRLKIEHNSALARLDLGFPPHNVVFGSAGKDLKTVPDFRGSVALR